MSEAADPANEHPEHARAEAPLPAGARTAWRRIVWLQIALWLLVAGLIIWVAASGVGGLGPYAPRRLP